jgi:hypothetical protein
VRLVCQECRRENEPERIYCHDCGTRLHHSELGLRSDAERETAAEIHKRVSGMFAQRGARARAFAIKFLKVLAGAGAAAVVLLMLLPPANLPPVTKSDSLPPQISLDLESMTQFHRPQQLRYSEAEVNAYLAYVLGKKKHVLDHVVLDFDRAAAALQPDRGLFLVGRSIFGYSVYSGGVFTLELQSGKINATPVSGAIGRLPIHPKLMQHCAFLFNDVLGALDRERKLLAHVRSIQMRDKEILFTN